MTFGLLSLMSSAGSIAPPWTPSSLTGLLAWYKGDAGLTLSGSTVVSWADQSVNANDLLQPPSAIVFPSVVSTLNGLSVVSFARDIGSFGLETSAGLRITLGGTTLSIFMVALYNSGTSNDSLSAFLATGDSNTFSTNTSVIPTYCPSDISVGAQRDAIELSSGATAPGTWTQLGSIFDGTNNTVYINNSAQTPAASSASFGSTGNLFVGSGGPFVPFGGQIAEVIVTNTAVSSTDRNNINTYFTTKWGVPSSSGFQLSLFNLSDIRNLLRL